MSEFSQSGYKVLGMTGNEEVVYGLLHLLGTANACFNPILYGYLNENFRNEYKSIYRRMPWYSHSFHINESVHVVQLPRDQLSAFEDLARSRQQLTATTKDNSRDTSKSGSNMDLHKVMMPPPSAESSDAVLMTNDVTQSQSLRTFSSAEGVTPNYDDVITPNSDDCVTLASSANTVRPSCNGGSLFKSDDCDVFSSKFVHQAIGQMVTSLESCEERHWLKAKHRTVMETYV